jgi:hypothetical protein
MLSDGPLYDFNVIPDEFLLLPFLLMVSDGFDFDKVAVGGLSDYFDLL